MPSTAHFFTDPTKLSTQLTSYGPVSGNENTAYMVTSKLQFTSAADAIAVCTGYVFIQPHETDNSLVNLVLLPILADQIENNYTAVKYFIYRGLKKSNILTGSDEFLAESHPDASDLVNSIWQQYNMLKTLVSTIDSTSPNTAAVGWDTSSNPGTDSLNALLNADNDDFQLAAIQAGQTLAKFDMLNAGFEVMLEEHFYEPDLAFVRAADFKITTTSLQSGDIPGNQPIAKMRQRENILNFMDPAAWYMTFFKAGVNIPDEAEPVKGFDALYTTLLSTFITRNILYLDIRNENSYSLNYYKDNEGLTGDSDYGDHIQVSWDGITFAPANFYKDYWPILTLSPPANTNTNYNELHLKFRKLYNPEPLLYADYAVELISDTLMNISSSTKFKSETNPVLGDPWSSGFTFKLPNNPAVSGNTAPAFPIKLMNIRQKNPDIALPSTVVQKEHFLDNAFGPANYVPDVAAGSTTQWISGLGKRFIDGRNEMGVAGIFEIGMGISSTEVSFFASIIDEYRPGITLGRSQVKESTPETGGKSQSSSLIAELNKTWFKDRNFELQKQELSGSTFYIMDEKTLDPPTNISGLINLVISKSEYDAISIPSNLDTTIHAPLLSFQSFSMEADNNQVPYRKAALKVNGATSSGTKTTAGLGVDLLTFNYGMLNSEAAGNVVELEDAENGILTVDEFIEALKVVEEIYQDNLIDTCTRLRVHYYGRERHMSNVFMSWHDRLTGIVFNNTLPLSNHWESGSVFDRYRRLYFKDFLNNGHAGIYWKLLSHADENGPKGNPSPYLNDGFLSIDLGQILYGFESIFYQPHYPPTSIFPTPPADLDKPPENTYSPSYENFPVKIVNDLAGWVANYAIAITEYAYHVKENEPPPGREGFNLDFNEYYDYSNPEADIAGNVDAIGILNAYKVLTQNSSNTELRLSDAFILYYKGVQFLRESITLPSSPDKEFYIVYNRWKAFSEFFGFYRKDTSGIYFWVPDNPIEWAKLLAPYTPSNPNGKNYEDRLFRFSEFWNTKIVKQAKPIYQQDEFIELSLNLRFNSEVPNDLIERYSTTASWVKDQTEHFLINYFLAYIKNKIA